MFTSCSPTLNSSLYKIKVEKQERIEGKYYKSEMLIANFSTSYYGLFKAYNISFVYNKLPSDKNSYFTLELKYEGSFESSIGTIKLRIDDGEVIELNSIGYNYNTWYNSWTREVSFYLDSKIIDSIKSCNKLFIQVEDINYIYYNELVKIPLEGITKIKDFINMQQNIIDF